MTQKEWVEYFKAVHQRDPSPDEFVKAKEKGEFIPSYDMEKAIIPSENPVNIPQKTDKSKWLIWFLVLAAGMIFVHNLFNKNTQDNDTKKSIVSERVQPLSKEGSATFKNSKGKAIEVRIKNSRWIPADNTTELNDTWEYFDDNDESFSEQDYVSGDYYLVGNIEMINVSEDYSYSAMNDTEIELEVRSDGDKQSIDYYFNYTKPKSETNKETYRVDPKMKDDDWGPVAFILTADEGEATNTQLLINAIIDGNSDLTLSDYTDDFIAKYGDSNSIDHVRVNLRK